MTHLGLFAKYWEPTQVKTRLAASIGIDSAVQVYYCLLTHLLKSLKSSAHVCELVFTPAVRLSEFQHLDESKGWTFVEQLQGSLTEKLSAFFSRAFKQGAKNAIAIGADCPLIDATTIRSSSLLLTENNVVIGPAVDGGYYLIGLNRLQNDLFHAIDWSTSKVFEQTMANIHRLNLSSCQLPLLEDVDDVDSLSRVIKSLSQSHDKSQLQLSSDLERCIQGSP